MKCRMCVDMRVVHPTSEGSIFLQFHPLKPSDVCTANLALRTVPALPGRGLDADVFLFHFNTLNSTFHHPAQFEEDKHFYAWDLKKNIWWHQNLMHPLHFILDIPYFIFHTKPINIIHYAHCYLQQSWDLGISGRYKIRFYVPNPAPSPGSLLARCWQSASGAAREVINGGEL